MMSLCVYSERKYYYDILCITDESETNLKLYVDKHSGGLTIAGHDLDRYFIYIKHNRYIMFFLNSNSQITVQTD